MASLARTLILLAVPAAAVGAIAGVVLRAVEPEVTPDTPAPPPSHTAPDGVADAPAPPDGAPSHGRTPRIRDQRRVVGDGGEGFQPLSTTYAARLGDPDPQVRFVCAAELLRMGPSKVRAVAALQPLTDEGRLLRDRAADALSVLAAAEKGDDWPRLPEESRLELRLKYFGKVVPPEYLREERLRFWRIRTAEDPAREATGAYPPGQVAWHRLEYARVRYETGEIPAHEWEKARERDLPAARGWLADLRKRGDVPGDLLASVEEAVARLGR